MPPACGELTVELRIIHQRSRLLRGVGRVVPPCAVLHADRARAGLRYTNATSAHRAAQKVRAGIKPALALQIEQRR